MTRPSRVLVFSTVFPSPGDPTHGLFVWQRVRHLASSAELRIVAPVSFLRNPSRQPMREEDGIRIYHPRFFYVPRMLKWLDGLWLFLSSVTTVARLRREFRFELIDAHFTYPEGFAAILLGLCFRCPVVITERGTLLTFSGFPARRALADWTLRRAERVIAVAEALARRVMQAGVAPEVVDVIGNGVDAGRFRPRDRRQMRMDLRVLDDGPLLVSVGHLSKRKGFDRIVQAIREVRRRDPDVRLAIVGGAGVEGNEHDALVSLAGQLGVSDRIVFTGALAVEDVARWLGAADLFVFASEYEGCPNVLWEALATGCPVVTSNVGDAARIVPSCGGMIYDNPHDVDQLAAAITRALDQSWDRAAIRVYAEQHTWERVAERVSDVWRRAVAPPDQSRTSVHKSPA